MVSILEKTLWEYLHGQKKEYGESFWIRFMTILTITKWIDALKTDLHFQQMLKKI